MREWWVMGDMMNMAISGAYIGFDEKKQLVFKPQLNKHVSVLSTLLCTYFKTLLQHEFTE